MLFLQNLFRYFQEYVKYIQFEFCLFEIHIYVHICLQYIQVYKWSDRQHVSNFVKDLYICSKPRTIFKYINSIHLCFYLLVK